MFEIAVTVTKPTIMAIYGTILKNLAFVYPILKYKGSCIDWMTTTNAKTVEITVAGSPITVLIPMADVARKPAALTVKKKAAAHRFNANLKM